MCSYEVLWYEGNTEEEALCGDAHWVNFSTRKKALNYYEQHKNDAGCFAWWVTKRDADGEIVEDLVY